jgi:hypothetical protein
MVLSSLNSISSMTYYCIDMLGHNIIENELFRTARSNDHCIRDVRENDCWFRIYGFFSPMSIIHLQNKWI